ncbi:hypothetical protein [Methanoplanus limicola]|nr:hypothetical protein [Methanoplanus limicola]
MKHSNAGRGGRCNYGDFPASILFYFILSLTILSLMVQSGSAYDTAPGTTGIIGTDSPPRYCGIDGDYVIWSEYKKLILHNLVENKSVKISGGGFYELYSPKISDGNVIWLEWENEFADTRIWDLYIYNISSDEIQLIPTEMGAPRYPDISGEFAAWTDHNDVYLLELKKGEPEKISEKTVFTGTCRVDGGTVAWEGTENPDSPVNDLYIYNISTGKTDIVSDLTGFRDEFLLHDNTVIWADYTTNSSHSSVMKYDTGSKTTEEIARVRDNAGSFSASGDILVFTNFGFWSTDVPDRQNHLLNMTTGDDMVINSAGEGGWAIDVSGNRVVWSVQDVILFTYDPSAIPEPENQSLPGFSYVPVICGILGATGISIWRDAKKSL